VVRLLLERGADPDAVNLDGNLALHGAAAGGHASSVRLLLPRTRRADLKNLQGKTPRDFARDQGHDGVAALF
jgi:ankyrin repeat protein